MASTTEADLVKETRKAQKSAAQENAKRITNAMRALEASSSPGAGVRARKGKSKHRVVAIAGEGLPDGYLEDDSGTSCSSSSDEGGKFWDTSSSDTSSEGGHDNTPVVIVSRGRGGYLQDSSDTSDTSSEDCAEERDRVVGQAKVRGTWVVVEKTAGQNPRKVAGNAEKKGKKSAKKAGAASAEKSKAHRARGRSVRYMGRTWTKGELMRRQESLREQIQGHLVQAEMGQTEFETVQKLLNMMNGQ